MRVRRPHSGARHLTFMGSQKPRHSPFKSALLWYHCTDVANEAQRGVPPTRHGRAVSSNRGG